MAIAYRNSQEYICPISICITVHKLEIWKIKSTNYLHVHHWITFQDWCKSKNVFETDRQNFKKCSTDYSFISKEFHTQRPAFKNIKIFSEWCLTDHISTLEAAVGNPGTYYFSELFYQGVTDAPQRRVAKTHRDASWSVMTHQRLLPC